MGLDEAGTGGSAIGPAVVAGFAFPEEKENILDEYQVVDSKKVLIPDIYRITRELDELDCKVITERVTATEIRETDADLTELVARRMQSITQKIKPDRVHADVVSIAGERIRKKKLCNRIEKSGKETTSIKAAPGMDSSSYWASAASLFAKRDRYEALAEISRDVYEQGRPVYLDGRGKSYDAWEREFRNMFQSPDSVGYKYLR